MKSRALVLTDLNLVSSASFSIARIGAQLNRLDSAITNNQTNVESMTASRSRIEDADFSSETASLTRPQIMQQAALAVIAQANTSPQMLLSLLR